MDSEDYRGFLAEEYQHRQVKNPAYSQRAFARDLKISASFFSKLMNRQKRLAEDRAFEIASQLNWNSQKTKLFITLVRQEGVKSEPAKMKLREELDSIFGEKDEFYDLEADRFTAISKWYHLAILALTTLDGFTSSAKKSKPVWIAKRLRITRIEAAVAIARLERLGLLIRVKDCLVQTHPHLFIKDGDSFALRRYHREILEKASKAIDNHAPPLRDISGSTIPMDPARLPQANEIIRRFRREFMTLMGAGPRPALFHLSVQLFRLDDGT